LETGFNFALNTTASVAHYGENNIFVFLEMKKL